MIKTLSFISQRGSADTLPQILLGIPSATGYIPQLDSKTLLLKTPHTYSIEQRNLYGNSEILIRNPAGAQLEALSLLTSVHSVRKFCACYQNSNHQS